MTTNVDVMTSVLALEDKCALNYVMTSASPASYEKFDNDAAAAFAAAWQSEEPFLVRICQLISDHNDALLPLLDNCFDFRPSRLNFATWSHLLTVVPEMMDEEIAWLKTIQDHDTDSESKAVIAELISTKEDSAASLRDLCAKQETARSQVASGDDAAAEDTNKGSGDGFRDADMPIEDRLAAAAGKDKFTQLWAAMAQTDCTACGYDCEGYAQAIADGEDTDLGKCVPGEDATANALKQIVAK